MERLTVDHLFCDIAQCANFVCDGFACEGRPETGVCDQRRTYERLREYEDTNLSPEEITAALAELARYKQAEEEGRLVKLPVKLKDVIYIHDFDRTVKPMKVEYLQSVGYELGFTAECVEQTELCNCGHDSACAIRFSSSSMDGRIFLTREEAEAALAAQKEGE